MIVSERMGRGSAVSQSIDLEWAKQVLDWWVEHADAALSDGRRGREYEFCSSGVKTDELLSRENQTRRVIKVVLGMDNTGQLVRPLGKHNSSSFRQASI